VSPTQNLLIFSPADPAAARLVNATASWGVNVTTCFSAEDLRAKVEAAPFDLVLCESSQALRPLLGAADAESNVSLPLAEIEKRHILRVLASTGGNKTRAARVLGIDTKTLYNKLKAYRSSEELARKREARLSNSLDS
jgi:DNA-binding NtrC family response regulator